jgi:hypothetical protein
MTNTSTERYRGIIRVADWGDAFDILFLGVDEYPLADTIEEHIEDYGRYLTVRYWTAKEALPDEELEDQFCRMLDGEGDSRCELHYSEITGYLFTNEDLDVGGHDLLAELKAQVDRYLLLEITYSHDA